MTGPTRSKAQVDAARLRQQADQQATEARTLREDVGERTRRADELDPDVRDNRDGASGGAAARDDLHNEKASPAQDDPHVDRENPRSGI